MKKIRNCVVVCCAVAFLLTTGASQVHAASPNTAEATQIQQMALIDRLMALVVQLQAQLLSLQTHTVPVAQIPALITADDYEHGAPNAPIKILTFTDFDCPFCKLFHDTLNTVVENNSDVSVVYRHFPLEELHPNATELAIATNVQDK